jgi:hypothetical protein
MGIILFFSFAIHTFQRLPRLLFCLCAVFAVNLFWGSDSYCDLMILIASVACLLPMLSAAALHTCYIQLMYVLGSEYICGRHSKFKMSLYDP